MNQTFLWKASLIAGLRGVPYVSEVRIIAAALIFVRSSFSFSIRMEEVVVSVVLVESLLGAIVGAVLSDRAGRRTTLL